MPRWRAKVYSVTKIRRSDKTSHIGRPNEGLVWGSLEERGWGGGGGGGEAYQSCMQWQ